MGMLYATDDLKGHTSVLQCCVSDRQEHISNVLPYDGGGQNFVRWFVHGNDPAVHYRTVLDFVLLYEAEMSRLNSGRKGTVVVVRWVAESKIIRGLPAASSISSRGPHTFL